MKVIVPPIKSQGIKTKPVPWVQEVTRKADVGGRWVEPFLGTGVVAFNSGFEEALLNDINPHVIRFYKSLQDGTITPTAVKAYLLKEGKNLRDSEENGYVHFRFIRDRFNTEFSPLDFLFLSRTGFNGMMRFGRKGNWNIPFCKKPERFAPAYITKIVNQVGAAKAAIGRKWIFTNRQFSDTITSARKGDMIYCDPPYFGRYVDYYNGWTEQNEELLFQLLRDTPARFILSTWHHNDYRANDMVAKYWKNFNIVTKDHFYHSGGKIENRRTIVEALVCNFDLNGFGEHNHVGRKQVEVEQLELESMD